MTPIQWARDKKNDLLFLQRQHKIPALFMAAQMCHEAFNEDGSMSTLAAQHHNYSGLKFAQWQTTFGCGAVRMGTWEVLDGQRVDLTDAFCTCPDWGTWLNVYTALLTGKTYKGALQYASDPLLYGWAVWRAGWATDPAYLLGIANWIARLLPDYEDTFSVPRWTSIEVRDEVGNRPIAVGWLTPDAKTYAPVRDLLEWAGRVPEWNGERRTITARLPREPEV